MLALKAVKAFMDEAHAIDDQEVQMRFFAAWSMLHGMISLYNSKIRELHYAGPGSNV